MNKSILPLIVAAALMPCSVSAVTIDYRHEMKDTSKRDHKDRLLISHRFANGFGLASEVKWQSGSNTPDKPYNNTVGNGTEVVASYLYRFNPQWSLESGFSLESSSNSNNYRPYLRAGWRATSDVSTSLRYRPYYKRVANGAGEDDRGHQLNFVLSINFLEKFTFSNDFEWKHSENTILWDNDKTNWLYEGKLSYRYDKNWRPYVSVANVSANKYTDERQTRYRVGIQYVF